MISMRISNPRYTRLKAISAFGYNLNWDDLSDKIVAIPGIGGLGVLTSEMLARCGVGTLHLFDLDIVEEVNLNRMGFHEKDLGLPKVEVTANFLEKVNPEVDIIPHHGDIMGFEMDSIFEAAVSESDVVLMGLDNYPARMFVNQKCINTSTPLIDAGVSRSALSGNIHVIIPKKTACMSCRGRIKGSDESKERGLPCTASLPSTMALIASIQVQECLKLLLNFGRIIDYQTYNALTGEFNNYLTQKNTKCSACGDLYKD